MKFYGYKRSDGSVGIRNHVLIYPAVSVPQGRHGKSHKRRRVRYIFTIPMAVRKIHVILR